MKSVYCAVRTGSLNKADCPSSLKGKPFTAYWLRDALTIEHSTIVRSAHTVLCVLYLSENKQRLVTLTS